jgi:valyl-tRNA synthetase
MGFTTENNCSKVLAYLQTGNYFSALNRTTMAIAENPLIMHGVRGGIGKQLVFRKYREKTVVSAYPDMSERKLSRKQIRQTNRMKIANSEVRRIKADAKLRDAAQLRLNVTRNKLHHALLKEILLRLSKES